MAKIVLVGYGQMLNSLIEGIKDTKDNQISGVMRTERLKYSPFELFFKDIFAPSTDYINIKYHKLYDIKADSVNGEKFKKEIEKTGADIIIVGSWAEKFKKDILNFIPVVNFHPSLLPKNRGANPYFMDEKFDRGDIILQEAITIEEQETGQSLKDKTTKLARALVADFLNLYNSKQIQPVKQNEAFATYEHQITFKDTILDLNKSKEDVLRHIRALYPWAKPKIKIGRKTVSFIKYDISDLDEKTTKKKNGAVTEYTSTYGTVKGSDFLIRIYFI